MHWTMKLQPIKSLKNWQALYTCQTTNLNTDMLKCMSDRYPSLASCPELLKHIWPLVCQYFWKYRCVSGTHGFEAHNYTSMYMYTYVKLLSCTWWVVGFGVGFISEMFSCQVMTIAVHTYEYRVLAIHNLAQHELEQYDGTWECIAISSSIRINWELIELELIELELITLESW